MTRPFILDSDGGVDDAQALILLVANGRAPDIITTVFGNVGRDQATTNLLAVAAHLGLDVPVHRGADRPLTQPIIDTSAPIAITRAPASPAKTRAASASGRLLSARFGSDHMATRCTRMKQTATTPSAVSSAKGMSRRGSLASPAGITAISKPVNAYTRSSTDCEKLR